MRPRSTFRQVIAPLAAQHRDRGHSGVHLGLDDLLLALSLTATESAITAPVASRNFTGSSQFEEPAGSIAAGTDGDHDPRSSFLS